MSSVEGQPTHHLPIYRARILFSSGYIIGMVYMCVGTASVQSRATAATLWCPRRSARNIKPTHHSTCRNCRAAVSLDRRACLGVLLVAHWVFSAPAHAGFLEDFVKASQSDDISALDATVRLLDGVAILKQIQVLNPIDVEWLRLQHGAHLPAVNQ